ncbi:MAG: cyanophycin synthetase [Hymenobacter sp.]
MRWPPRWPATWRASIGIAIKTAFRTFIPSATKTPGRMNLYKFPRFEVIVDYAHNTAGITRYAEFMDATPATRKIGVVSGLGDRRDEDTLGFARIAEPHLR